jgi:hypothetical protein
MGWQSVYICDTHWEEQEGKRVPLRVLPDGVYVVQEPCYICGEDATIPVRRLIEATEGHGRCNECTEEGIIRVGDTWWCLNHLNDGLSHVRGTAEQYRRAWASGIAEAIGLDEFNGPEDAA